jgi:hypothetical protein
MIVDPLNFARELLVEETLVVVAVASASHPHGLARRQESKRSLESLAPTFHGDLVQVEDVGLNCGLVRHRLLSCPGTLPRRSGDLLLVAYVGQPEEP